MRLEAGLMFSAEAAKATMRPLQALMLVCSMAIAASSSKPVWAQDLSPRAYLITPLHFNAVVMTYSFFHGSVDFDGAAPITGATGTYSVPILGYYHSFNFLGRSANVNAALPYAVGNFQGNVAGQPHHLYRSGLVDFTSRVSVNLKGGPAMPVQEFHEMEAKDISGRQPEGIGSYGPI